MAGPRTVGLSEETVCDGSISTVGAKTEPLLLLTISPLPEIVARGVEALEVEGPALKKPPATELPMMMALPLSKLPPLRLGLMVPSTLIEP